MLRQPLAHAFVSVCAVVVQDQMQGGGFWKLSVQATEEAQEFLMPMAWIAFADDAAFRHLQRRKQRGGPIAFVVVRKGAAPAGLEGQPRLRAIQRLNLALFIDTQHHGVLRRRQIHPHHIRQLFQELGIAGEFEAFRPMRFELVLLPHPLNRVLADAPRTRQGASAPMRRALGLGLQRRLDNPGHRCLAIIGFAPPTGRNLPNATDSLLTKALAPQSGGAPLHLQGSGHLLI